MKHMKKLFGLLLAVVMTFAMSVSVFADDTTYTITLPNNDHTYEIYQIFTGTYNAADKSLSNIRWGKNGTGTENEDVAESVLTELKNVNSGTESAKLDAIKKYAALDSTKAYKTEKNINVEVPAGYYLIKDVDGSQAGKYDAYTTYVVLVAGNITLTPKSVKPTVDKQVLDETADAEEGNKNGWGESADHAINETFQFKLTAKLPKDINYEEYSKYTVKFTDTMSEGVTFESITSVKVGNVVLDSADYITTAQADQKGGAWSLTIADVKTIQGVTLGAEDVDVEVIYNAHLNEKAYVNEQNGTTTNENKVYLEYSNNPNVTGEGELGKTPEDSVWVFTYQVKNQKVDEQGYALSGAGFRLYKEDGTTEIPLIYDETLQAYRLCKSGETSVEMKSADTTGKFDIKGLDTGTYVLKETTTPKGYNTCQPVTVKIDATHKEDSNGIANATFVQNSQNINNTIENKKGASLPTTGGIGTTVFYVVGGILMAGAAILLITKKKMSNK